LTPSGELLRATLLGGSLVDTVAAMAVDAAGNVYLVGTTKSTDFPLVAAYQPTHGANYEDTFVAKLDATGTKLVYSTFLGGLGRDTGAAIAVDLTGNAYVTGTTDSPDFPTKSAFSVSNAGLRIDAFVTKLGPAGE